MAGHDEANWPRLAAAAKPQQATGSGTPICHGKHANGTLRCPVGLADTHRSTRSSPVGALTSGVRTEEPARAGQSQNERHNNFLALDSMSALQGQYDVRYYGCVVSKGMSSRTDRQTLGK